MADIHALAEEIHRLTLRDASKLGKVVEERLRGVTSAPAPQIAARAIRLGEEPDITEVKAILDDGTEIPLTGKLIGNSGEPSPCAFFGELADGSFSIKLRLDWRDKDKYGDPMLDANISFKGKNYDTDKEKWHHTKKAFDHGEWVHNFEFGNIKLRFKTGLTRQRHLQGKAYITPAPEPSADDLPSEPPEWAEREKQILCTMCTAVTIHELKVDRNKEIVATCKCGHFVKSSAETEEALDAFVAKHHEANRRQVGL